MKKKVRLASDNLSFPALFSLVAPPTLGSVITLASYIFNLLNSFAFSFSLRHEAERFVLVKRSLKSALRGEWGGGENSLSASLKLIY
jgi:hypothetical protein